MTPDGLPKLARRRDGSILGGVAGGIADHLHVPVLWVRATFALLAIFLLVRPHGLFGQKYRLEATT